MSVEQERSRLKQAETLAKLRRDISPAEMLTVYQDRRDDTRSHGIYCALIPSNQTSKVLDTPGWNLMHGDGLPSSVKYREDDDWKVDYLRYGNEKGIEPLVMDRAFHGIREDYLEISEEFRLFHNLYHDSISNQYVKIDEGGDEQIVAAVKTDLVKIRLKEIQQFLAIKEMHLSIQFDCREYSEYTLRELGLIAGGDEQRDRLCRWALYYGERDLSNSHRAFSRLFGKRLIQPLPKAKSGFWGFAEERKKYVDFILGVDDSGDEVEYTCDPDALADYFGGNQDAPHYLTSVSFRKQVLDKYYQQPSKYEISDGILRCGSLWGIQIDNHHDDKVCAWLGDLGRDLPYKEQLHWKTYNIVSESGVSQTYFRQQILNRPTDSGRPEHIFQRRLGELEKACQEQLGWPLILPLKPSDKHHFQSIRVPSTDEQRDFDELVLGLAKILIDSLNEEQLKTLIPHAQRESLTGSISRLEAALAACGVSNANEHISFLRKLQKLRSAGSAHRKGNDYDKIAKEFGVDNQDLRIVFTGILKKVVVFLDYLFQVLPALSERESARRLAKLGGSEPQLGLIPRRRSESP